MASTPDFDLNNDNNRHEISVWEGLQERGGRYTKQELNMDMGRSRGSAKLSLIRRRRTTSRKNTTALRTSYLLKLLRSTRVRSKVIQSKEIQLQNLQHIAGNLGYSGCHQTTKGGRHLMMIWIRKYSDRICAQEVFIIVNNRVCSGPRMFWNG